MTELVNVINSTGFPIVACCIMFYLYNKQMDVISKLSTAIDGLSDRLDSEKGEKENEI